MKKLGIFLILAIITVLPFEATQASGRYDYQCDKDAEGNETLCIAAPAGQQEHVSNPQANADEDQLAQTEADAMISTREKGKPPRDRSKMKAQSDLAPKENRILFGATDVTSSEALATQTGAPKSPLSSQPGVNLSVQEKIRQVETFLQPIKGPQGFGEQGPSKAGH